jgi:anti-anti-sigma factor
MQEEAGPLLTPGGAPHHGSRTVDSKEGSGVQAMKLTLIATEHDVTRIQNEGDITQMDFRAGTDLMANLLGPDGYSRKVLLNLEKTPYIDSAGVGWMVMCHKHFKEAGGRLVIHSVPPMVNQILRLLRMPDILYMAGDEAAAKALALGEKK